MKTPLAAGETLLKEGTANLFRGFEAVGGKLYLTNRRLIFESHAFNVQTGATLIELATISRVEKTWTKLLGLIPLIPNSIVVSNNAGEDFKFVVTGNRDVWIKTIFDQKQK